MEKQLTSPVVPSRHKTAPLFIILTKPVPPWHQWHTPPTPHWPVTTLMPLRLRLRCRGSSCPLFVIYSPISDGNIQPLTPPCIDRAQMFTWFPSSYLHETAFNKVGQVHLVCNFVIMVLHNLFAEFEWDCSAATCAEDNLAYFVIIAPRDISFLLVRDHDVTMMDSRKMWAPGVGDKQWQPLARGERRETGEELA